MTDKKVTGDLNDFFKKQNTKKAPPKKKGTTQDATEDAPAKEAVPTAIAVEEIKAEAPKSKQETAYESSEEEKTDLTLGDDQAMIKDRKEVEAERRKKQEQENGVGMGWRALESQNKDAQEQKGPSVASVKTSGKGDVKFTGGKPTFGRKVGVAGGRNDFPELGSVSQEFGTQKDSSAVSKKDQANIGDFGNTGVARKQADGEDARTSHVPFEERKPATKPVFTSSKKTKIGGGADLEEVQNSKQNYDFGRSGMMVSTATDKVAKPRVEGEEGYEERPKREYDGERPKRDYDGERPKREYNPDAPKRDYDGERPKREYNAPKRDFEDKDKATQFERNKFGDSKPQKQADFDEDFETVTEKKRVIKPHKPSGEMSFGKPSFSKGGNPKE